MNAHSKAPHWQAYIDLIKRSITNYLYLGADLRYEEYQSIAHYNVPRSEWKISPVARPMTLLSDGQLELIKTSILALEERGVTGDYIEAGVWRGGAIIFMRAMIEALQISNRKIFAADSFSGIPMSENFRYDPVDKWPDRWVASLPEVKQNLLRFGLLDDKIQFVEGLFSDSLGKLQDQSFALIRIDCDSHDSTTAALNHLYPLLMKDGIIIIDDWHLFGCKVAVEAYRARHGIKDEIMLADGNAWWVKQQDPNSERQLS